MRTVLSREEVDRIAEMAKTEPIQSLIATIRHKQEQLDANDERIAQLEQALEDKPPDANLQQLASANRMLCERVEALEEAATHGMKCSMYAQNLLCWECHRLYIAAGLIQCKSPETCYICHREDEEAPKGTSG